MNGRYFARAVRPLPSLGIEPGSVVVIEPGAREDLAVLHHGTPGDWRVLLVALNAGQLVALDPVKALAVRETLERLAGPPDPAVVGYIGAV